MPWLYARSRSPLTSSCEWQRSIAEGYAALAEAEADRPGITSPSDALNAAREAAELARSLSLIPAPVIYAPGPVTPWCATANAARWWCSLRLALCDQITCLLVSLVGEPFGQLDRALMPSDLRAGG